jgi:hypothetical protein
MVIYYLIPWLIKAFFGWVKRKADAMPDPPYRAYGDGH